MSSLGLLADVTVVSGINGGRGRGDTRLSKPAVHLAGDFSTPTVLVCANFQPAGARYWAVVPRSHGSIWAVTFAQTGFSGIPWPVFSRVTLVAPVASASA